MSMKGFYTKNDKVAGMMKIKKYLTNKNILLGGTTTAISVFFSCAGISQEYRGICIFIGALSVIAYIVLLVYFTKEDKKLEELSCEIENIKCNKVAFEKMISHVQTINDVSASIMQKMIANGIDFSRWDFGDMCRKCCEAVYDTILELKLKNSKISVSYVTRTSNNEEIILNAYKNKTNTPPHIYNKTRGISNNGYYDARLFLENNAEYTILLTEKEIAVHFQLKKECKYSQYFAIPVVDKQNITVGLLQITFFNNAKLASNKEEVENILAGYVRPFVSILLLFFQVETFINSRKGDKNDD